MIPSADLADLIDLADVFCQIIHRVMILAAIVGALIGAAVAGTGAAVLNAVLKRRHTPARTEITDYDEAA